MSKRNEFTLKTRLEAMAKYMRCPSCDEKFGQISNVEFDHIMPDALDGLNDVENCMPLCIKCHKKKTNGKKHTTLNSDMHTIAKSKRLRGITKQGPKKKIASRGFNKNLTNKFDGTVVRKQASQ